MFKSIVLLALLTISFISAIFDPKANILLFPKDECKGNVSKYYPCDGQCLIYGETCSFGVGFI